MGDSAKTTGLTTLALTGFAANTLLCRQALGTKAIDPSSFTAIRIFSGALTLAVIARVSSPGGHGRSNTRAAVVQLSVPVLAAAGGVALLGEVVHTRLVVAAGAIVGGIALAVLGRRRTQ